MSKARDLSRLSKVAQLTLDHRLGQLRASAAEVERSRMQLASINASARTVDDIAPVTAERVVLSYERWADVRRSELNLVIARQTVAWMEARGEAQAAFGRVQALQGLATRQRERK